MEPLEKSCFPIYFNEEIGQCDDRVPNACKNKFNHLCEGIPDNKYVYIEGTNCKEYVMCETVDGERVAYQTECAVNYFDPEKGKCSTEKPEIC